MPPGRATYSEQQTKKGVSLGCRGKKKDNKEKEKKGKEKKEKKRKKKKSRKNELSIFRNCDVEVVL
jgi:hypothetical protein